MLRPVGTAAILLASLWAAPAARALNEGLGAPPPGVDRSSPLATVQGFSLAAHDGDYARAAHYLFLEHLPKEQQAAQGPRLARRLRFVLDRKLWLDFAAVSRAPQGDPKDQSFNLLGTIALGRATQPIRVQRVALEGGQHAWVYSEDTVRAIELLFEQYGPPFAELLPPVLFERSLGTLELWQWLGLVLALMLATALALVLQRLALAIGGRVARLTSAPWDDEVVRAGRGPLVLLLWSALVEAATRGFLFPPPAVQRGVDGVAKSLVIAAFVWFALRALKVGAEVVQARLAPDLVDGRSRALRTQIAVLRRIAEVALWVVGAALFLMQFEVVRSVGVSLLASAGIAGLVIGLAAQKSISSLLAGIQLSVTQPIRLGDTVIVEGQFGTIEEIRLTYVVVRVWDLRRLVVPIAHFLEKPFENWSRTQTDILGTVLLKVDFTADVEAIRAELKRLLESEAKGLWDGKAWGLQVTESDHETMTLRALASAANPGQAWDLRCLLRERLLQFIQANPTWLPIRRTEPRYPPPA